MKVAKQALVLACTFFQLVAANNSVFARDYSLNETKKLDGIVRTGGLGSLSAPSFLFATKRARELSNQALQYINLGNYAEAEPRLRAAIALEPQSVSAHCNLGFLLNKTGRAKEAIDHLEFAAVAAPNESAALVTLAAAYQLSGDLPKAVQLYSKYLQRFPYAYDAAMVRDVYGRLQKEIANNSKSKSKNELAGNGDYLSYSTGHHKFHWTKKEVTVYVEPAFAVQGFENKFNQILVQSFYDWQKAGVVNFKYTIDKNQADIDCLWTDNVANLSSPGEGGEALLSYRGQNLQHATIKLLTMRQGLGGRLSDGEIKALCLHEIGHALGLYEHSPDANDIMYCTLSSSSTKPSERDIYTLQKLYNELNPLANNNSNTRMPPLAPNYSHSN